MKYNKNLMIFVISIVFALICQICFSSQVFAPILEGGEENEASNPQRSSVTTVKKKGGSPATENAVSSSPPSKAHEKSEKGQRPFGRSFLQHRAQSAAAAAAVLSPPKPVPVRENEGDPLVAEQQRTIATLKETATAAAALARRNKEKGDRYRQLYEEATEEAAQAKAATEAFRQLYTRLLEERALPQQVDALQQRSGPPVILVIASPPQVVSFGAAAPPASSGVLASADVDSSFRPVSPEPAPSCAGSRSPSSPASMDLADSFEDGLADQENAPPAAPPPSQADLRDVQGQLEAARGEWVKKQMSVWARTLPLSGRKLSKSAEEKRLATKSRRWLAGELDRLHRNPSLLLNEEWFAEALERLHRPSSPPPPPLSVASPKKTSQPRALGGGKKASSPSSGAQPVKVPSAPPLSQQRRVASPANGDMSYYKAKTTLHFSRQAPQLLRPPYGTRLIQPN